LSLFLFLSFFLPPFSSAILLHPLLLSPPSLPPSSLLFVSFFPHLCFISADWFVADTGSWTKQMLVENETLRRWRQLADSDGVFRCQFATGDGREVELEGTTSL